jgi:membrane protein
MPASSDTTVPGTASRPRRALTRAKRLWRSMVAVIVGFQGEQIGLRAGNLTFVTVTSLVPLAAVIISLVHLFGANQIDGLVKRFFTEILSPGGEQSVRAFFAAANSRAAGGLSFLVVMVSAGVLLRHLDASLNDVWAVRRKRPILVSIGLYTGVLVVGPLLIAISLVGSEGAKHLVQWLEFPFSTEAYALGAVAAAIIVFTLLYKFAPHAPVPWKSAFIGGVTAGIAWELARNLYGGIASVILNANMLYGSLGVAPLFLMWVYVGWYIILSGARLAYAVEHADFHDEFADLLANPRSNELIATRIAELATRAVLDGKPGVSTKSLSATLVMPEQRIRELVTQLIDANLLGVAATAELAPTRDPATLTLADISDAVGGAGRLVRREASSQTGQFDAVARLFQAADESTVEKLKGITWESLAQRLDAEARKP